MVAVTLTVADPLDLFVILAWQTDPPSAEPLEILTFFLSPYVTVAAHLYVAFGNLRASG